MSNLLRLEKYELRTFSVVWHDLRDPQTGVELTPAFDYKLRINQDDPRRFALDFECDVSRKGRHKEAFEIKVFITGYVTCPEEWEEDKCGGRALHNGCTILYGIIRGLVATATGQFPYGSYFLPSVNMLDVFKLVEQAKAKEKRKVSVSGPAETKAKKSGLSKRTAVSEQAVKEKTGAGKRKSKS